MRHYVRFATALLVLFVCGSVSLVVDLDHVLVLLWKGLLITWTNLGTQAGRPLHIPLLLVSGIVCVYFGARFGRFLVR